MNRTVEPLKPCPFCGGDAYIKETFGKLHIDCHHTTKCPARPNTWLGQDRDIYTQIDLWNRRYKLDGK